jgi:alpha-tubulin suppressor-like RCC1 family protein
VRVSSIAAAGCRSYAVADTGELWAWGIEREGVAPIGHGDQMSCPLPKPIESLRGIKVDAVIASYYHQLALAADGSAYAWGHAECAAWNAPSDWALQCRDAGVRVRTCAHTQRTELRGCAWRVGFDR